MKSTFTPSIASKSIFLFVITLLIASSSFAAITSPANDGSKGVIFMSVTATTTEKSILIDWKTASEDNNNHFEVERSTDKINFKTVAIVLDGFSEEGTGKRYAFKESINELKNSQVAYYRLKQIDVTGKSTYSEIIKVSK